MVIEEESIRFVAAADWTDECRVDVRMRRKHMDVSAAQAREFAAELVEAAEAAEKAAGEAVRPVTPAAFDVVAISPDCREGKHFACMVRAWDDITDSEVSCSRSCHASAGGEA